MIERDGDLRNRKQAERLFIRRDMSTPDTINNQHRSRRAILHHRLLSNMDPYQRRSKFVAQGTAIMHASATFRDKVNVNFNLVPATLSRWKPALNYPLETQIFPFCTFIF